MVFQKRILKVVNLLIADLQLDVPETKNQNSMLYKQLRANIYKSQVRKQIKDTNSPKGTG